uniref:Sushi domain-containing protein n=1 Tax=Parascaris univalens TaxID=6257 RepID=A0A915ADZ0_PARUN
FVAMWCFFVMQLSLWCILMTSLFTDAATSLCPTSGYPSEPAPISVWTKPSESGGDIYRLGGEELLAEGYHRGAHGNDTLVVVLNRGPPHACPLHKCALRLTTNETLDDGTIVYHANEAATSPGHKIIYEELSLYCVRNSGDCGADVPIFTFKKPSANAYAYSIDPSVSITGFKRDAKPLCYGWSDRTITLWDRQSTMEHPSGCKPISSLINGEVIYQSSKSANFPFGSTATVQCKSGFTVVGPTTLTCTHFGWYPESALGSCVVQDAAQANYCEAFPSPQDGYVIYSAQGPGIYPSGTTAVLHCDTESGTSQITQEARCENGLWSKFNPGSCQHPVNNCSQLPSVLNGQVEYITDENGQFGIGTKAKLRCAAGYVPIGVDSVTCGSDGWMPVSNLGTCQLKSTENAVRVKRQSGMHCIVGMPMVLNGQVNYSHAAVFGPFPHGTQAALICNVGFKVSGESAAVCNGQSWQPASFGICIRNDSNSNSLGLPCHFGLPPPIGGTVSYSQGSPFGPFPSGTAAYLECTSGFPQGSTSSRCTNGQWNPSALGACTSSVIGIGTGGGTQCLFGIGAPLNGRIHYSNDAMWGPFPDGTSAGLVCYSGSSPSGATLSTCQNGQWAPTALGQCIQRGGSGGEQCHAGLPTPFNGQITYSNNAIFGPFPSGTSAALSCNFGHSPSGGSTQSTCKDGKWSPSSLAQCLAGGGNTGGAHCSSGPMTPANGQLSYSNGMLFGPFPPGTSVSLSCNFGYSPSGGSTQSTCKNGNWSPSSLAQCLAGGGNTGGAHCFSGPMTPANGQLSYSNGMPFGPFPSGTVARLTCTFGFTASGPTSSTCSNGAWNPPTMPQCIQGGSGAPCQTGVFPPLNGRVTYSNGALSGPFPSGTTVTVSCNLGYAVSGTVAATCINGQFNPTTLGQCVQGGVGGIGLPAQCFGLVPPFNGQISYSQQSSASTYPSGTIATLICNLGFTVSGGSTASTCINGQWNPSTLGTCQTGIGGSSGGTSTAGQCLFALPSVSNGNIQYSGGNSVGPFHSGTSASLICNFGFTPTGSTTSFCSNGVWQPSNLGSCRTNGINEYNLGGSNVPCLAVFPVLEGQLSYSELSGNGMYHQGTVVVLTCNAGYSVSGLSTATCFGGGWTPFPGIGYCKQTEVPRSPFAVTGNALTFCPAQMHPFNGNINYNEVPSVGSFPTGTVARLQCNLGFTVSGPSSSTCSDGVWSPQLGVCQAGIGSFSGSGSCTPLAVPNNGKIFYIQAGTKDGNELGTAAILTCETGFTPSDQTMFTCTAEGWAPKNRFPACLPANQLQ